ncbi:hypothetical protein ACOJBO_03745 [Rhizobium beringeri]
MARRTALENGGGRAVPDAGWRVHNGTSEIETTAPPGTVSVSGVQPAMQSILVHHRGDFAPPEQQAREGA